MKKTSCIELIIYAVFFGIIIVGCTARNINKNEYTIIVQDKCVKNSSKSSRYMVSATLSDDSIRVFVNKDELLQGKFNSSDLQAKLKIGETYGNSIPRYAEVKDLYFDNSHGNCIVEAYNGMITRKLFYKIDL